MLILWRRVDQSIVLTLADGRKVEVMPTEILQRQGRAKIGIDAPADVPILRSELVEEEEEGLGHRV